MARIRNGQIRRDFKRLLAIIASAAEPDFSEVEEIAKRHGLFFDEKGEVHEVCKVRKAGENRSGNTR